MKRCGSRRSAVGRAFYGRCNWFAPGGLSHAGRSRVKFGHLIVSIRGSKDSQLRLTRIQPGVPGHPEILTRQSAGGYYVSQVMVDPVSCRLAEAGTTDREIFGSIGPWFLTELTPGFPDRTAFVHPCFGLSQVTSQMLAGGLYLSSSVGPVSMFPDKSSVSISLVRSPVCGPRSVVQGLWFPFCGLWSMVPGLCFVYLFR